MEQVYLLISDWYLLNLSVLYYSMYLYIIRLFWKEIKS